MRRALLDPLGDGPEVRSQHLLVAGAKLAAFSWPRHPRFPTAARPYPVAQTTTPAPRRVAREPLGPIPADLRSGGGAGAGARGEIPFAARNAAVAKSSGSRRAEKWAEPACAAEAATARRRPVTGPAPARIPAGNRQSGRRRRVANPREGEGSSRPRRPTETAPSAAVLGDPLAERLRLGRSEHLLFRNLEVGLDHALRFLDDSLERVKRRAGDLTDERGQHVCVSPAPRSPSAAERTASPDEPPPPPPPAPAARSSDVTAVANPSFTTSNPVFFTASTANSPPASCFLSPAAIVSPTSWSHVESSQDTTRIAA